LPLYNVENGDDTYLGDEDSGVVNTEWMTGVTLTTHDAQAQRTTSLDNGQRLRIYTHPTENITIFNLVTAISISGYS